MATRRELELAKKAKQRQFIHAVVGTTAELGTSVATKYALRAAIKAGGQQAAHARSFGAGMFLAGVIDLTASLGIAAWQLISQKREAKKKARLTRKQQVIRDGVDGILDQIESTGLGLIEEGAVPGTQEFELALYHLLFQKVGYKGNCNAIVWVPGTKPGPRRPIWFRVKAHGRLLTTSPGLPAPSNLQTLWYVRCRNIRDGWVSVYQEKLITEGRIRELQEFQESLKKGKLVVKIVFGVLFSILMFVFVMQATRIK